MSLWSNSQENLGRLGAFPLASLVLSHPETPFSVLRWHFLQNKQEQVMKFCHKHRFAKLLFSIRIERALYMYLLEFNQMKFLLINIITLTRGIGIGKVKENEHLVGSSVSDSKTSFYHVYHKLSSSRKEPTCKKERKNGG